MLLFSLPWKKKERKSFALMCLCQDHLFRAFFARFFSHWWLLRAHAIQTEYVRIWLFERDIWFGVPSTNFVNFLCWKLIDLSSFALSTNLQTLCILKSIIILLYFARMKILVKNTQKQETLLHQYRTYLVFFHRYCLPRNILLFQYF